KSALRSGPNRWNYHVRSRSSPAITRQMKFCIFLGALLALAIPCCGAESCDIVIRHGRIADGSGNPAFFADLGITAGKITAIGRITCKAKEEIDAKGMVVAPGFI